MLEWLGDCAIHLLRYAAYGIGKGLYNLANSIL